MDEFNKLLDHLPELVNAYGKWPSFAYLFFATAMAHRITFGALCLGLYHWLG
jgi:hypothetical protein